MELGDRTSRLQPARAVNAVAGRGSRILLMGATGYIGGRLAPRLAQEGHDVRYLTRRPQRLAGVPWADGVEIVQGDALDPASLGAAMDGVDVVYYLDIAGPDVVSYRDMMQRYARVAGLKHRIIIPQLASGLPDHAARLDAKVAGLDAAGVTLDGGERVDARAVVVATEGPTAHRLLGRPGCRSWVTIGGVLVVRRCRRSTCRNGARARRRFERSSQEPRGHDRSAAFLRSVGPGLHRRAIPRLDALDPTVSEAGSVNQAFRCAYSGSWRVMRLRGPS